MLNKDERGGALVVLGLTLKEIRDMNELFISRYERTNHDITTVSYGALDRNIIKEVI